jgi:ribosomal protein L17
MQKNLAQQLAEELTAQTKRAQALQQIVDELFTITEPGALKNALWARYQGIEGATKKVSNPHASRD